MENKKKLVIGVIGADVHAVGISILDHAFTAAGFEVTNLGVMVSQEEYIAAALETDADAIMVSSLYGHGELDCRGLREKCQEKKYGFFDCASYDAPLRMTEEEPTSRFLLSS